MRRDEAGEGNGPDHQKPLILPMSFDFIPKGRRKHKKKLTREGRIVISLWEYYFSCLAENRS